MRVYIKFLTYTFFKSLLYVFLIMISLVFILNLLSELEFFKELNVEIYFPLFLALLNSPATIFEMFPFVFLITTQLFFIKLFSNNEIEVFKYSGLKNSKILITISIISILVGILITTIFYNFSSNFKNLYLELKSKYTTDGKYLAVITNNGLWIKDEIDNKILIINSSEIKENFLINNFITEFDENYSVLRNYRSEKIDINSKEWIIYDAKIYKKNNYETKEFLKISTNFDYKRIQTLYSNLTSLNIIQLLELKKNYLKLNYSLTEVDLQLLKLASYPIYLVLITIFSSLMMLNIKRFETNTIKIAIGLFFSVIIYYINNFFFVLGSTERLPLFASVFIPLIILMLTNSLMIKNINEK
tara:strand:+ start:1785 stop:2858 length:1074 start_codon:yes stop_codon:yes gene_type:complete